MVGKQNQRIEAKLDALLEKAGLKPADFDNKPSRTAPRRLSAAEKQAIDNAPDTPIASDIPPQAARTDANNAPVTPASVPNEPVRVPSDTVSSTQTVSNSGARMVTTRGAKDTSK